jgi:Flp pilus assembly protein TadG
VSRRLRDDEGSIAPMIPLLILSLLLIGGLVIDGARDLNARGDAQGYAEEAARAGATGIDTASAQLKLDRGSGPHAVQTLVDSFCTAVKKSDARVTGCGPADTAYTDGDEPSADCDASVVQPLVVHTQVTMQIHTTLLGILGVQKMTATGTGKARPFEGTDPANAC